jgi:DNA modification methylase
VDFEKLFFFTKQTKYYFEQQFEPALTNESRPDGVVRNREYGYQGKYKVMPPIGGIKKAGGDNPTYSGNTPEYNPLGRNKRCVWKITTQPLKEAHFASYPEKLVETPILAGCPEFICKVCGKAREKVYKEQAGIINKNYKLTKNFITQTGGKESSTLGGIPKTKTQNGYTDCGHGSQYVSGIVLDPFMGSGTTGLSAIKNNRNYVGIELNSDYIKIANKRIDDYNKQVKLF